MVSCAREGVPRGTGALRAALLLAASPGLLRAETLRYSPCAGRNVSGSHGYAVVREMFCGAQLEKLVRWAREAERLPDYDERRHPDGVFKLFERSLAPSAKEDALISRVEKMTDGHEGFRRLLGAGGPVEKALAEIFDESFHLFKEKIHYKLPGGGGYRWHIDGYSHFRRAAKVPKAEYLFYVCVVALDDFTESNGGMRLLPEAWPAYEDRKLRPYSTSAGALVPLRRGDMLVYDHWMPHMSEPNLGTLPRRSLFAVYNPVRFGDQRARYYLKEKEGRRKHEATPNGFFTGKAVRGERTAEL